MRFAVVVAALLSLSGCYSIGDARIADPDTVSLIVPGKSAKDDVVELVGKPSDVSFLGDGRTEWHHRYELRTFSIRQLLPIFGWLLAGPDIERYELTVLFDSSDVVERVGEGEAFSKDTLQGAGKVSSKKPVDSRYEAITNWP